MEQIMIKMTITEVMDLSFKELEELNDKLGGREVITLLIEIIVLVKDIMVNTLYISSMKGEIKESNISNAKVMSKGGIRDMIQLGNKMAEFKHIVHDSVGTDIDELLIKRFYEVVDDVVDTFSK